MTPIISLFIITIILSIFQNNPPKTLYVDSDGRLYRA